MSIKFYREIKNNLERRIQIETDLNPGEQQKQYEKYMEGFYIDNLTKIGNRTLLTLDMHNQINQYLRTDKKFGFLMIDFDDFKKINNNFGHYYGDLYLKNLATFFDQRISHELTRFNLRPYRFGGDEFGGVIEGDTDEQTLKKFAEISNKYVHNIRGKSIKTSISIGYSNTDDISQLSQLLKHNPEHFILLKDIYETHLDMENKAYEQNSNSISQDNNYLINVIDLPDRQDDIEKDLREQFKNELIIPENFNNIINHHSLFSLFSAIKRQPGFKFDEEYIIDPTNRNNIIHSVMVGIADYRAYLVKNTTKSNIAINDNYANSVK